MACFSRDRGRREEDREGAGASLLPTRLAAFQSLKNCCTFSGAMGKGMGIGTGTGRRTGKGIITVTGGTPAFKQPPAVDGGGGGAADAEEGKEVDGCPSRWCRDELWDPPPPLTAEEAELLCRASRLPMNAGSVGRKPG